MTISKRLLPALFFALVSSTTFAAVNGPVKSVTLSSGGLAEVVRSADVGQDNEIAIEVPLDQIDDVLKSLIVRDAKGEVKSLSLAGPNPLEETFRTLPFKPDDLRSMPKLLDAIKGAKVRAGDREGVVLGVTETQDDKKARTWQLSIMTNDGEVLMSPIPGTKVEILDTKIKEKLQTAISAIAKGNTDSARTITLKLAGKPSRSVDISYVVPAPIWKTSYRLVTAEDGTVRLQAWAVFENASGEDWNNVSITLSSGKPVTLKQALHQHFMRDRTEVPVDTAAVALSAQASVLAFAKSVPHAQRSYLASESGVAEMDAAAVAPAPFAMATGQQADATEGDVTSTFALKGKFDISNSDTISVPILDKGVKAEMVSLYRADRGGEHPVAAALVENDSGISLPQGIMTVYEDMAGYVGDAQIAGLPNGKKEAISFAVDQKVTITSETKSDQTVTSLKVIDGMIHAKSLLREETTYTLNGAHDAERTVVVEIPKRPGWSFKADAEDEGSTSAYRLKAKLATGETRALNTRLELVTDEVYALADANALDILNWQKVAADEDTKTKLLELGEARRNQTEAQMELQRLDEEYLRTADEQERARQNVQAVAEGDTRARFDKRLNELEDRLVAIEERRVDQRKVIENFTTEVGDIIRTF